MFSVLLWCVQVDRKVPWMDLTDWISSTIRSDCRDSKSFSLLSVRQGKTLLSFFFSFLFLPVSVSPGIGLSSYNRLWFLRCMWFLASSDQFAIRYEMRRRRGGLALLSPLSSLSSLSIFLLPSSLGSLIAPAHVWGSVFFFASLSCYQSITLSKWEQSALDVDVMWQPAAARQTPGSGNSAFLWIWLGSSSFTHTESERFDLQSKRRGVRRVEENEFGEINVKLKPK